MRSAAAAAVSAGMVGRMQTPTRHPRSTHLPPTALVDAVRALVIAEGVPSACRRVGVSRTAVLSLALGAPVYVGTIAIVARRLGVEVDL